MVTLLLVGLAFSGLHHGLILLFLFLGMCWLGLHVHSDNSAVVAMLSRWSARPLRCIYFCSCRYWFDSLLNVFSGVSNADALARNEVHLFPSLLCLIIPWALLDPLNGIERLDQGVHGYLERSLVLSTFTVYASGLLQQDCLIRFVAHLAQSDVNTSSIRVAYV